MGKILLIDTSSNKEIVVGLKIDKKEYIVKRKINTQKAQIVLPLIDNLLEKRGLKITDINEIKVNTGSGSFTGIRVGTSIANAFAFALEIPVKMIK